MRRLLSPTGGSVWPSVMAEKKESWYACHARVSPAKVLSVRGSPAAADAASCSGVKRAGIQATEAAAPEKRRSAFEASELGIPQSIVTSFFFTRRSCEDVTKLVSFVRT